MRTYYGTSKISDPTIGVVTVSPDLEEALDWLCGGRPIVDGQPETIEQFEKRMGKGRGWLYRWKKDLTFRRLWEARMRDHNAAPDRLQKLIDAQYERAMKGDTKAFEAYMRHVGKLMPTAEAQLSAPTEMSDAELEEAIARVEGAPDAA